LAKLIIKNMFNKFKKNKQAFTLVELLVVVFIIGLLTSITIYSIQNSKAKSRDVKRVNDISQIQMALEKYYNKNQNYPAVLSDLSSSTDIYLATIPEAPNQPDGDCTVENNEYVYTVSGTNNTNYTLSFCLGDNSGDLSAGVNQAVPGEI